MDQKTLKGRLFKEFGGFGDKRIKNLEKSDYFICDDRDAAARDAQGKLFGWYCTVALRVVDGDVVHIEMGNAMPRSESVDEWWKKNTVEGQYGRRVIEISKGNEGKLDELAKLVSAIVKKPYDVRAYKYSCPEVSSVLKNTAKILKRAWAQ